MTSPTHVTARFYGPERRRLEQAVGPVEIAGFGANGMTMPGTELRRRIRFVERLVLVLKGGVIAGAALDVYPVEPLPADSPLRTLDKVVLSPHLAGASTDVVRHHSRQIVDDLLRLERGERPLHVANPEVFASTFPG